MRAAHADYYRALVARARPASCAAPGRPRPSRELGLELPNLRAAVRHLVYTDRLDDAGDFAWSLLIYWWIAGLLRRGAGVDAGAARQGAADHASTRGPSPGSSRCGARCGSARRDEVVAGLGECVRLFTESGDEDAAAMALAARATARCSCPIPTSKTAPSASSTERGRAPARPRQHAGREAITEVSRGRLAWLRGSPDDALAHFDRATEIAEAGGDLFTLSVAGNHLARLRLRARRRSTSAEEEFVQTLLRLDAACTTRRASPTGSRASAPSRRPAATAAGAAPCAAAADDHPAPHRRVRRRGVHGASAAARRALRRARPGGGRGRREAPRRRADASPKPSRCALPRGRAATRRRRTLLTDGGERPVGDAVRGAWSAARAGTGCACPAAPARAGRARHPSPPR